MRRKLLGVTLCAFLPLAPVQADVDVLAVLKVSITISPEHTEDLLAKALNQELDPALVVTPAVRANPEAAGAIVTAAIGQGVDPVAVVSAATSGAPEQAQQIITAAILAAPDASADALIIAAIGAGADPTTLTEATAAGNPNPGALTPGQANPIARPPNFSQADGNGGRGRVASPS